jgi:hypothetical protein
MSIIPSSVDGDVSGTLHIRALFLDWRALDSFSHTRSQMFLGLDASCPTLSSRLQMVSSAEFDVNRGVNKV